MSEYIEVGTTAMRDPRTDTFLPSVPLYIRAEDWEKISVPVFDGDIMVTLAGKYAEYRRTERKAKKNAR